MKKKTFYRLMTAAVTLVAAGVMSGCSTTSSQGTSTASAADAEGNGSKLWAQNCIRCHNMRPPTTYSDAQWEVVMMHMRIRANLTPNEHKQILAFLKGDS
jgi:hypothetical protein